MAGWVTDRVAERWLTVNIEPHDVLPDQPQACYDALPREFKEYQKIGRDGRDENYFLQMTIARSNISQADPSMGGQPSLALNRRVTGLIVQAPAGADASGPAYGGASGYPNWQVDDPNVRLVAAVFRYRQHVTNDLPAESPTSSIRRLPLRAKSSVVVTADGIVSIAFVKFFWRREPAA